jgi:hypothetical protein
MGQQEIINILAKERGREFSIVDLCCRLKTISRRNISRACKQLSEHNEIKIRKKKIKNFTSYIYRL